MSTIPVVVEESNEAGSDTLGLLTSGTVIKHIDAGKIRQSLSDLSGQISEILQDIKAVGDFKLKEVSLSVQIGAEGGVALIGTAKAKASGAISLKFSA